MRFDYKIIGDKELQIYLNNITNNMKPEINKGLNEIGIHLQKKVKDKFGEYQEGWPKLKRETVIAKARKRALRGSSRSKFSSLAKSFNSSMGSDDPLSLFGDLEGSVKRENNLAALSTKVYSDNEYAAVHEYGYAPKNIPARSYMRLTLYQEEEDIVRILSERVGRLI